MMQRGRDDGREMCKPGMFFFARVLKRNGREGGRRDSLGFYLGQGLEKNKRSTGQGKDRGYYIPFP